MELKLWYFFNVYYYGCIEELEFFILFFIIYIFKSEIYKDINFKCEKCFLDNFCDSFEFNDN